MVGYHSWNLPPLFKVFPIKREGFGKIGGCFKKRGWPITFFTLTIPFQSYLWQCKWWFLFCLFTPYVSVFFVLHVKNLFLLNLINKFVCMISNQGTGKKQHCDLPYQSLSALLHKTYKAVVVLKYQGSPCVDP